MDHRDYKKYSLDELYEALNTVDEVENPGQRAAIENLIESIESSKKETPINLNSLDPTAVRKLTTPKKIAVKLSGFVGALALTLGYIGLTTENLGDLPQIFGNRTFLVSVTILGGVLEFIYLKTMTPIWKAEGIEKRQAKRRHMS